jgi:hypothetical protein
MSRESVIFVIGILVIIVPHLGIPADWKLYCLTGMGVLLMIIGYSLRRAAYLRSIEHKEGERRADSFVEHVHPSS